MLGHWATGIKRLVSVAALALVALVVIDAQPAAAMTPEECAALVAEGQQAREDLAKLIDSQGTGSTDTTSPELASYLEELLDSAAINEFGFVSADAGAPLELCVPEGTDTVTLFSDPVVLWTGLATTPAYPITVEIPAGIECGTHTIEATGAGVSESVETQVAGACVTTGAGGTDLPRTGADIGRLVGAGVALIAVGWAVTRCPAVARRDARGFLTLPRS